MTAFTLDTSGVVLGETRPNGKGGVQPDGAWTWRALDAFTQGYIAALFESEGDDLRTANRALALAETGLMPDDDESPESAAAFEALYPVGFSDLAPDTLARIVADCAAVTGDGAQYSHSRDYAHEGAAFWSDRIHGALDQPLPPLTVQLGDAGKVIFA